MYVLFLRQQLDTKGITSAPKLVFNSLKGKMNIAQPSQDLVHMTYKHFSYLSIVGLMSKMTKFVPDLHGLFSQTDTQECLPFLPVWFLVGSQLSPPWQGRWTLRKQIQILKTALYVQYGHRFFLKPQISCEYNFVFITIINEFRIKKAMNQTQMLFCLGSVSTDLHSPSLVWAACV